MNVLLESLMKEVEPEMQIKFIHIAAEHENKMQMG
jgi:hypothetical protein